MSEILNLLPDPDDDDWVLNYDRIAESEDHIAAIRLLAVRLRTNPYISLGDWLVSLSPAVFEELNMLAQTENEEGPEMEQLLLLTLMISHAEGTASTSKEMTEMCRQLSMLRHFIIFTALERKGMIRCYYENFTLGEDLGDRIIVERL